MLYLLLLTFSLTLFFSALDLTVLTTISEFITIILLTLAWYENVKENNNGKD